MICVKLQGGLGNQLFQYATALALAEFHQTTVSLDLSFLKKQDIGQKYTLRHFALDLFDVPFEGLTFWDEVALALRPFPFQNTAQKVLGSLNKWMIYNETTLLYNSDIRQKTSKNSYLTGYFQSEYYFNTIESELRKVLQFKNLIQNELSDKIEQTNSVSLHIRRGDYATNQDVANYHGLCSLHYYQNAARFIADQQSDLHFFIFSDEIQWAKQHLKLPFPTYFIEGTEGEDLRLMSLCKFNIIANSSFSWWGAWLNNNPGKIVIAPENWFADEKAESQSSTIVPKTWIRL